MGGTACVMFSTDGEGASGNMVWEQGMGTWVWGLRRVGEGTKYGNLGMVTKVVFPVC